MGIPRAGARLSKKGSKVFYGWWIVAIGVVMNALAGGTYWTGFSVFFLPITRDFGLTRAATSFAYGVARLEGGLEGPAAGYLVDRVGPGKLIFVGALLAGVGFILLAFTHNFASFLLVYLGVLSLGFNSGFNHGVMAAVNNWFSRHRGLAMSMVAVGMSVGGAVIVPLMGLSIRTFGWRPTAAIAGVVVLVVVLPLSFWVRRSPESMGLRPDGDPPVPSGPPPQADVASHPSPFQEERASRDFTAREAFGTRSYWLLAFAIGLRIAAHTGVAVHIVPLMVWKGQTEAAAALLVGVLAFTTLPVRLFVGWMGDRWSLQRMASVGLLVGVGSLVLLMVTDGRLWQLVLFVMMFAVPESIASITWAMIGDFFGRRSFATLRGVVTLVQSLMAMGAPVFAGWVYDRSGSYMGALVPIAISYAAGVLLYWYLPRPRLPRRLALAEDASAGQRTA
ncbi:MAG: MFS transporter [Chloroflexi bacterium]|nr:MFS transporter [Chloroflexota bacterium]